MSASSDHSVAVGDLPTVTGPGASPGESGPVSEDDDLGDDSPLLADDPLGERSHLDEHGQPRMVARAFQVDEAFGGQRLDHYLKRMIPRLSRTKLQLIIKTQLTRHSGLPVKPHSPVVAGEQMVITRPARPEPPCPLSFEVLYEDDDMLVIDKPAGLPVHASAKFYFNTLTRVLADRYPGAHRQICHRLDRETSGALVVAKHRDAARSLKLSFAKKRAKKSYLAVVHGQPPWPDAGDRADDGTPDYIIDAPLGLVDSPDAIISIRMVVRTGALPSVTHTRVIERAGDFALVRATPITGRQHQIRAHLAHAGFPIVGDKLYAHGDEAFASYCDGGMTDDLKALLLLDRQALHAASIRIPHPVNGHEVAVDCPLAADLRAFLVDAAGGRHQATARE